MRLTFSDMDGGGPGDSAVPSKSLRFLRDDLESDTLRFNGASASEA